MTSVIERRSSSVEKDVTTTPVVTKENYHQHHQNNSSILREKICNNEILGSSNYNNELTSPSSPWLCNNDVDAIKEKIRVSSKAGVQQQQQQPLLLDRNHGHHQNNRRDHHQRHNQRHNETSRYRYLDSEKFDDVKKRSHAGGGGGIRTRSESEPNDICNMRHWMPQTEISTVDEEYYKKSNDNQQLYFDGETEKQRSSHKLPPKYPNNHVINSCRRMTTTTTPSPPSTPPRLSIYSTSSRSPGIIRKSPSSSSRTHSSAVTASAVQNSQRSTGRVSGSNCGIYGSPRRRSNNSSSTAIVAPRRCRTKSPSPTFTKSGGKYYGSTALTSASFRKARSVTPPLKRATPILPPISLPPTERIIILKSSKKTPQHSAVPKTSNKLDSTDENNSNCEDDDDGDFEDDFNDDDEDVNSSSDSDNGYRVHAYTTNFEKSSSSTSFQCGSNTSSTLNHFAPPASPLVPSLFPNVPPYLAFSTDRDKGPHLPAHVHKILKWKLTTIMPKVVRRVLINSGFRLLKKTNDWMGTWGKHMKSPCFRAIRSYQKINHLPGSFKIGRKDSCWKNLQMQMMKHGKKEFGFMPKTYIIPQDLKMLRKSWPKYAQRNFKWIIKPPASARGTGIKVVNRWSQIPKRRPMIVQRYIERPFLINSSKFDLRLYVLVTSINPLRVYLYHDGLVRFASVKYSEKSDTLSDRCMHLTNYSINKFSSNYAKNEDVYACHGHKWTIKSLWAFFEKRGINTNRLWSAFRNLILRTLLAGENSINAMIKLNVESKYNCFELFGFDILLDSELVPWLLEVNISPSLHSELPLDLHVKAPLVQAVLNTALYHIPPKLSVDQQKELLNRHGLQGPLCFDKRLYVTYLSRAEKLKHQQFTRKSLEDRDDYLNDILENLTPDDIRCLITSEDELSRCGPLERIFPTQNTHKYLKYTETPRYYNRLLDAWEHRYGKDRPAGINLLKDLCEQKLHLDTPPAPMRRPIKIRTRALLKRKIVTTTTKSYWALTTAVKSIKRRNNRKSSSSTQILMKLKQIQEANSNSTTTTTTTPAEEYAIELTTPLTTTQSTSIVTSDHQH